MSLPNCLLTQLIKTHAIYLGVMLLNVRSTLEMCNIMPKLLFPILKIIPLRNVLFPVSSTFFIVNPAIFFGVMFIECRNCFIENLLLNTGIPIFEVFLF